MSAVPPETIELVTPLGPGWTSVSRMVLGGIADRLDIGYEDLDDLQLAVERLLAEADGSEPRVRLHFEFWEDRVTARIGPLRTAALSETAGGGSGSLDLTLGRVLRTVLDSFAVEPAEDGRIVVYLEKAVRRDGVGSAEAQAT